MNKRAIRRWLSSILAVTVLATSLQLDMIAAAASKDAAPKLEADATELTITDGQIVANWYDEELSEQEKDILDSEILFGDTHVITAPTADDGLLAVDSDNKLVYAKKFVSGGYTWVPEAAKLVVDNVTVETMGLTAGSAEYDGVAYDASASFAYTGDGYSVSVTYNTYVDIDVDTQDKYLNIPYELSSMMAYLDAMDDVESVLKTIMTDFIPEIVKLSDSQYNNSNALLGFGYRFNEAELNEALVALYEEFLIYNDSKMNVLVQDEVEAGVPGYANQIMLTPHILEYAAVYEESVKSVYEALKVISGSANISSIANLMQAMGNEFYPVYELAMNTINGIIEDLEAAATAEWPTDLSGVLVDGAASTDITAFDTLVRAAGGRSSAHVAGTETSLLVATKDVACNVNRYNVQVLFEVYAVDADNNVSLLGTQSTTVNLASATAKADVIAAIDATGAETALLDLVNSYDDGIYNVNTTNYTRTVVTDLTDELNADASYKVTYNPITLSVDYTDAALTDVEVPYGTTISLPTSSEEGKSYEYTIDGEKYDEAEKIRVTKNLTIERTLQKSKTTLRLYDLIAKYFGDVEGTLTADEKAILQNLAVKSGNLSIRMPGDGLVTVSESSVKAVNYDAGDDLVWAPYVAYVLNNGVVVETIYDFNAAGVAAITADDFTNVEVEYRLKVDIDDAELLTILNIPYTLVEEAASQLSDMNTLLSYESNLGDITAGLLEVLKANFEADAQDAIDNIVNLAFNGDVLYLAQYIGEYKTYTTNVDRLAYYYENNTYAKIKQQVAIIADNLAVIVADPNLTNPDSALYKAIVSMGYEEYIDRLGEVSGKLGELKEKFVPKNENIDITSGALEDLLALLVAADANEYTEADSLYCVESIVADAPLKATIKITVQVADSNGNIASSKVGSYSATFDKDALMTQSILDTFAAEMLQLEAALGVNAYYEMTAEGALPAVGDTISGSVNVVYTWSPKEYKITLQGEAGENVLTYENRRFTLIGTGDAAYKYVYDVCGRMIEVAAENVVVTLTVAEFESLFASADTAEITRETIDVATERLENLIASINGQLASAGKDVALIPYRDADGNLTLVLRLNPFGSSLSSALQALVFELANQTYVAFGENALIDEGIHTNALISLILNSGLGTDRLLEIIKTNGDLVEDAQDKVAGQTVVTPLLNGVAAGSELGSVLIETTFSIVEGSEGIPMYITLEDFGGAASELKQLREVLVEVDPYVNVILEDDALKVDINAPEKAHELFLAAMLMQGELNVNNFETPTLVEMMEFVEEMLSESVLLNEDVTAETLLNTLKDAGVGTAALEGYVGALNTVLTYFRNLFDEDLANTEFVLQNEDGQDADLFKFLAFCPMDKVIGKIGLPEALANSVYGDIEIPTEIRLENCNAEYTAAIVDLDAAQIYNKVDLTQDTTVSTAHDNTVIVLLGDVETLNIKNKSYVDLNGNTVGTMNATAAVTVFDSSLSAENAGTIETISGQSNVTLTAGNYEFDAADMLPTGFVQEDGAVFNRFYKLSCDEDGNITVAIAADFMEFESGIEFKQIALEMAVDVLLNAFTWASLDISGNGIYAIELYDLEGIYSAGLGNLASDLVEMIDCDGVEAFVNDVLATITDFAAIQAAIESDSALAEYTLNTAPW